MDGVAHPTRRGVGLVAVLMATWSCSAPVQPAAPVPVSDTRAATLIEQLAGCFEVTYRFVEDGVHDIFSPDYGLTAPTKEWIGLRRTDEHAFALQHVLFVGPRPLAHWYETWQQVPDSRDWTQQVWGGTPGPDSERRYGCTAPWVDGQWECHAGRAAKPLRDDDRPYEWLDRKNILQVTPHGYVQNQHNRKMTASGEVMASELGWVTYRRLEDVACAPATERYPKESLGAAD